MTTYERRQEEFRMMLIAVNGTWDCNSNCNTCMGHKIICGSCAPIVLRKIVRGVCVHGYRNVEEEALFRRLQ